MTAMRLVGWFWAVVTFSCMVWLRFRYWIVVIQDDPAPRGASLILAKHSSSADIPLLGVLCHRRHGVRPYFQMGSFVGYRLFGPLVPAFRRLGGFPVMRPKEVRRLCQRKGWDRRRALERMKEVNDRAEEIRKEVLLSDGVLVVFPEGTRDPDGVRPLISELEVRSALEVAGRGRAVSGWPVVLSLGTPRRLRRVLMVRFCPPFALGGQEPKEVLARVEETFRSQWLPPDQADAAARRVEES